MNIPKEAFAHREFAEPEAPCVPLTGDKLRIARLERRIAELERQVSNYGWEASARHAAATGGTL